MKTTSSSAMCTLICAFSIAVCSAISSVSIMKQYPRASVLIALYKWGNTSLNIRAPLILSSKAAVYFNFTLAVVNFSAAYFANHIAKYVIIDAFLSMLQIMHIVIIPAYAINLCTLCISAYARQVFAALNKPTVSNAVRFIIFTKLCSLASAVTMTGLPLWAASDGAAYYPAFLQGLGHS